MSPRPYWKGYLKLSLVSCPIAVHAACSSQERVSFRQINRKTAGRRGQPGRRGAVHDCADDPRRHEGERRQMADVPVGLAFLTCDSARHPATMRARPPAALVLDRAGTALLH
jgi:hypothetical protein